MNKHIKTLVIVGKVYVAWKRKMLRDVIGGHQEYIFMKRLMAHRILQLAKTTRGYQTTRALRARRDYKVATLSAVRAELRSEK